MSLHPLLEPGRIGTLELRNRVIKTATFEGMTPGGRPTERLTAHHVGMARSGVGMTTVAYGAVSPEGRTFADQLLLDEAAVAGLTALTEAVHEAGAAVSVQLTHCGGFSKLPGHGPPIGPSAALNPYGLAYGLPRVRAMTPADLARVRDAFGAAATLAAGCGVDAVELHWGHGYLLSQFLSPLFNRRSDGFGGDLEGRLRFPVEVLRGVREALPDHVALLVKHNLEDGVPGGLTAVEGLEVGRMAALAGADALVPSGGLVSRNAFFLLRGEVPIAQMAAAESSWLQKVALRAFAPFLVRPVPFAEGFFLDGAKALQEVVDVPVVALGGLSSAAALDRVVDADLGWAAMGRALLADPDFLERLGAGERVVSRCTHCNQCVAEMDRDGVRCVI